MSSITKWFALALFICSLSVFSIGCTGAASVEAEDDEGVGEGIDEEEYANSDEMSEDEMTEDDAY